MTIEKPCSVCKGSMCIVLTLEEMVRSTIARNVCIRIVVTEGLENAAITSYSKTRRDNKSRR